MNAHNFKKFRLLIPIGVFIIFLWGCERDVTDLSPAPFPNNPEVFIDDFSPGLNYAVFGGTVPAAFGIDNIVTHNGSRASMRFEVPDAGDPRGAYAGGVFFTSNGRDLSGFTALTFWAKATQAANIDLIGFGNDFGESKYQVSVSNLPVNTNWRKYIIPIPDPSKLKIEKGMLFYAEGPENDRGYTFWIDDVKFENLGTVAHPRFSILNGQTQTETSFIGVNRAVEGLVCIFNLPTGTDQTFNIAPAYFEFVSSNPSIATVAANGRINVIGGPGNSTITAKVGDVSASGSLTINSIGNFQHAPTPTHPAANVISVFSNAYTNVPVDYFNGYWAPWQTTLSADFVVNGDHVLHYTNFNFVGIQFGSPQINAATMTHLRLDIYLPNALTANAPFRIELVDNAGGGTGLFTFTITPAQTQQWISLDIPLSSFAGLSSRNELWQLIFVNVNGNIPNFYVDNIYFRRN